MRTDPGRKAEAWAGCDTRPKVEEALALEHWAGSEGFRVGLG
jgi:hypothetical protein